MNKYKLVFIFPIIFMIHHHTLYAQSGFQKRIGTLKQDISTAVLSTDNKQSIFLAGTLRLDKDSSAIEIIKLDSCFNTLYAKKIYENGFEYIHTTYSGIGLVKQNQIGDILMAAITNRCGANCADPLLISMRTDGSLNWANVYSLNHNSICKSIDIDKKNGYIYMLCESRSNLDQQIIIKLDSNGNLIWSKIQYLPNNKFNSNQIIVSQDQSLFVIGTSTNEKSYLTKYDQNGNILWNIFFPSMDLSVDISKRSNTYNNLIELNKNLIITGITMDYGLDGYLISIKTTDGSVNWKKSYRWNSPQGSSTLNLKALTISPNNTISIYGYANSVQMVFKADSLGIPIWVNRYHAYNGSFLQYISNGPQDSYYLTGYVSPKVGNSDFQLIKTDSLGKTACGYETLNVNAIDRPWVMDTTIKILDSNATIEVIPIQLKSKDIAIYQRTLCTTQEPFAGIGSAVDQDTIFVCDTTAYTIVNSNSNPNSKYYWNTGDTTRSITVNKSGRYILRIVKGACESIDSVYIIIAPVYHSSLVKDTATYAGCQILLDATPKKTYPGSVIKYIWNTKDTTQTVLASKPGIHKVTMYNQWNCAVTDSIYIRLDTLKIFPSAKKMTICDTTFIDIFSNADTLKPKTMQWNTGEITSNIHVTQTGKYILTIEKNSCKVCDSIQVNIAYKGTRNLPAGRLICPNQTAILDATPQNTDPNFTLKYLWNTGDTDETVTISKAGLYTVRIINPYGCRLDDSCFIYISDTLKIQLRNDTLICPNTPIDLWAIIKGGDSSTYQFTWYDMANNILSHAPNYTLFNLNQSQKFIFEVKEKCGSMRDTVFIKVRNPLIYQFNHPINICKGDTAKLIDIDSTIDSVAYTFNWKTNQQVGNNILVSPKNSTIYKVSLTDHCLKTTDTLSILVNIVSPKAFFEPTPQTTDIYFPCILYKNKTSLANTTFFYYGLSDSIQNFDTLTYCYSDTGTYISRLIASNLFGCTDTFESSVYVKDVYTMYIPNAFTPNNDSKQLNETFFPVCSNCESWELSIYNIWGENIYHAENKTGGKGWDGTYKDTNCPNGLYLYTLKIKDNQGGIHDEYQGTVMLMR